MCSTAFTVARNYGVGTQSGGEDFKKQLHFKEFGVEAQLGPKDQERY